MLFLLFKLKTKDKVAKFVLFKHTSSSDVKLIDDTLCLVRIIVFLRNSDIGENSKEFLTVD